MNGDLCMHINILFLYTGMYVHSTYVRTAWARGVSVSPGRGNCKPLGWCSSAHGLAVRRNGHFGGAVCLIRDFQIGWDKQWPRCHLLSLHGAAVPDIYVAGTYRWPDNSHVIFDPGFARYIPGTDAEPHTSDYQAFHLADCTNLQTTKLCRLHHFGIYTAPKYPRRTWLPLVQKPLLKFGLGNRSGGYKSARPNQNNRHHQNTCRRSTDYVPKGFPYQPRQIKQYCAS